MVHDSPFLRLSLLDASDSAAGVNAWLRAGVTVAEGESAAATLTGVVGALSDAVITSRHIVYRAKEIPNPVAPGLSPAAGAGVFVFSCAGVDQYAVIVIPAIRLDILTIGGPGGGVSIDTTSLYVTNLVDVLTSSIACNPFGAQLLALESAFYQWRP